LEVKPSGVKAWRYRYTLNGKASMYALGGVDELLLLGHLRQHPEVDTAAAAVLCQRSEAEIRERLSGMESNGYVEHGGAGRGTYWCLSPALYRRLTGDGQSGERRRIDWDAAKVRVLSILMERARRGEPGLSNQEIRQITHYDRSQVRRLMQELQVEHPDLQQVGERRWARYEYINAREH